MRMAIIVILQVIHIKKMRRFIQLLLVFIAVSCSSTKVLQPSQHSAQKAIEAKEYTKALGILESLINSYEADGKADTTTVYELAGKAALGLADTAKAERYFKLAVYHQTASAMVYDFLATYYHETGNLSKEVMALEGLEQLYPESAQAKKALPVLFERYVETAQWDEAATTWHKIETGEKSGLHIQWMTVALQRKDTTAADETAAAILSENPAHYDARMWQAKRYYEKGESRYQQEIAAYEKNKTNAQYAKLLKGLEVSTADFKEALKRFESLFEFSPDPRTALYIANIYARFGDEKNTSKYRKLSSVNP